jgi:hypothetical protein
MFPFRLTATAWAGHGLFMHGLLAHAYHLALHILAVGLNPVWRPFGVALAVALAGRVAGLARLPQGAGLVAAGAVLAGWVVQDWPLLATWPPPPIARLVGLAVLVLVEGRVPESRGRRGGKAPIWLLPVFAACAAWWMRGAPMDGAGIVNCMPVFLGLCAALPLARRLARGDSGWGCVAVASALAGGLLVTGAAPHWARAALVPGLAALALIGLPAAASACAGGRGLCDPAAGLGAGAALQAGRPPCPANAGGAGGGDLRGTGLGRAPRADLARLATGDPLGGAPG